MRMRVVLVRLISLVSLEWFRYKEANSLLCCCEGPFRFSFRSHANECKLEDAMRKEGLYIFI